MAPQPVAYMEARTLVYKGRWIDGHRDPTPIKRCEPWYMRMTPQLMMMNQLISQMNITDKPDLFNMFLKNKEEKLSQFY
ncbi:hypothetical protein LguiB_001663 [Lonicera macranthoides]